MGQGVSGFPGQASLGWGPQAPPCLRDEEGPQVAQFVLVEVLLALAPSCPCISSSEGAVSGLVGRITSPLDTYFWQRSQLIPLGGGSGLLGRLMSNPREKRASWATFASAQLGDRKHQGLFPVGGGDLGPLMLCWSSVSWVPNQAFFLVLLFKVPSGRLRCCFQICSRA